MSVFREREIRCGGCDTPTRTSVALSIHGSRAPALLDEIRAGRFGRVRCEACGADTIVDGPLLVIDFEALLWVQVYPRAWLPAWRALEADADRRFEQSVAEHAPAEVRVKASAFHRRCTFGLDGLREKLVLRDARLDDVAVEVAKLVAIARRSDGTAPCMRIVAATEDELLLDAPAEPLCLSRARVAELGRDPAFEQTRAQLKAGTFVDAQRIFEPGTAPSPFERTGAACPP